MVGVYHYNQAPQRCIRSIKHSCGDLLIARQPSCQHQAPSFQNTPILFPHDMCRHHSITAVSSHTCPNLPNQIITNNCARKSQVPPESTTVTFTFTGKPAVPLFARTSYSCDSTSCLGRYDTCTFWCLDMLQSYIGQQGTQKEGG